MGAREEATLSELKAIRREIVDVKIGMVQPPSVIDTMIDQVRSPY